jgi:hypothetical protein
MSRGWITAALPVLACAALCAVAGAQNYQPLDTGSRWIYTSPDGGNRDTIVAIGPTVFDGEDVIELRYHGYNEGLSNYWTVDPDGSVLLHGWDRSDIAYGLHYTPALRMVHPPYTVGASWQDVVTMSCVRSPCTPTVTTFVSTNVDMGPLTVPAGAYTALAVQLAVVAAPAIATAGTAGYSVVGTRLGAQRQAAATGGEVRWWADGVGMIQNYDGWNLVSFDQPTPAISHSWAQIKMLYR